MSTSAQIMPDNPDLVMRSLIQRIATGPHLSKDISQQEARAGMRYTLQEKIDPVQAAIFLIALRMKRETDEEYKGVLEGILDTIKPVTVPVDEVVDIADPYGGYNRTLPISPFLPPLLAELGVPCISQGVESAGPKYGITHRKVLRAAGAPVDLDAAAVAIRLGDPKVGWSYIDQRAFCPQLHNLSSLRAKIIKRTTITTAEVLTRPVRGRARTHLVTGYVHKAYPRIYAMLARHAGYDSALLVRGTEGGIIPSLRQPGKMFHYHANGEEQPMDLNPADLGIDQVVRAVPLPEDLPTVGGVGEGMAITVDTEAAARAAADLGMATLKGQTGPARDALIYSASIILWHLQRFETLTAAAAAVRDILDRGLAARRVTVD